MSTAALSSRAVGRPAVNPWFVAVAVVIPTFMEVVDTTVANVALRYIAGGLSAAVIDSEWVITSYLAANAFVLPITGWLSAHFGRRNYFLTSIAVFTLASALCGMATSLPQLVLFRVLQGLGGRRTPAVQPGGSAGRLSPREAGRGHDHVRRRRPARPGRRPDAGRLARRYLPVALDLLHQPPGRRRRLPGVLRPARRPGLPQTGAGKS